jgi:putative endonuclease
MGSNSGTLYTGMTNNIFSRVMQHRAKETAGFTARYDVTRLVFYETLDTALAAIRREKQIKGWTRKKKIALIESVNPRWKDLSEGWGELLPAQPWQVRDPLAEERAEQARERTQRLDEQRASDSKARKQSREH